MQQESPGGGLDAPAPTRALALAACGLAFEALPPDVVVLARHCLLDWLGVTLAGSGEPLARILRSQALEEGGNPQASLLPGGEKLPARLAAMVNGAASHALDYDDVHLGMGGHPTVPVMPAVLALAEAAGAPGQEFVTAFVAGFETECRLGALVIPGHYDAGWHATGTVGTFGAAAACARLLRLDAERFEQALGIAGAQAAGLKAMFGTMCKPLHAGKAAANGLLAASLAARGFTSNPAVVEAPQGFAATQAPGFDPERRPPAGEFHIRSVLFKYHAACFGTHATIEALRRLRQDHRLRPEDVEQVVLRVPPGALAMCNIAEPRTGLEAKFSLRFTAALALAGEGTQEADFSDRAASRPDLVALRDRVAVEVDPAAGPAETEVVLRVSGGATLRQRADMNVPATDLDAQWARLSEKFDGLAGPLLGEPGARRVREAVARVETLESVADLVALCVPPARVAAL
jgi:2-methylcitrate dehydratase PrpD